MGRQNEESLAQMDRIGIKEILDHDPRPTFALDLDPDGFHASRPEDTKLDFLFCNEALRTHHLLYDLITGDLDERTESEPNRTQFAVFRAWATSVTKFDDSRDVYPCTHMYQDMLWTGWTVRKKWRLISGNKCSQAIDHLPATSTPRDKRPTPLPDTNNLADISATSRHDHIQHRSLVQSEPAAQQSSLASTVQAVIPPKRMGMPSRSSTKTSRTSLSAFSLTLTSPQGATPDWTVAEPQGVLSDHVKFMRSIDWASTTLGSMNSWSLELRQAANLVVSNAHPAALFWGHDCVMLYNEAYRNEVAGNKHPEMMGTGAEGPYREVWEQLAAIFTTCVQSGRSLRRDRDCFFIERNGYLEETYFSWSMTPLFDSHSNILGFYNAPFETTHDYINERRMHTLQQLSSILSDTKSIKQFWNKILLGLEENHHDVPFALLYSIVDSDAGDEESVSSGSALSLKSCVLEGSIAVPADHPAVPTRLDLKRGKEGFIPFFREAMMTREPTRLSVGDGSLPEHLLDGVEWRGFGEPCREVIIFPVRPTNGDNVLAFLLLGVNPRREFDRDYQAFVNLLNTQLATALASVLLFEDEIRRAEHALVAANQQQDQLNEQLTIQTNRLQRMTSLSPLGMFYINPEGLILEANDRYYEMTLQDRNDLKEMGWMEHLAESSKPTMIDGWHKLTVDLLPWTAELQLHWKRPDPLNPNGEPIDYWVMASSQPEFGIDGELRSVMGCITDISGLKWAQGLQERRLQEAEERRRQQNEFIDITSHETRNPLSAIIQCADDIASTLASYQNQDHNTMTPLIASCIESANTIALCVQHQKSIVDDILTVSKLDSNLLGLSPTPSQPVMVARSVMKMFESELIAKKIKFDFLIHPDYEALGVDWVSMDPSRVSQILINLMTNAIKFTHDRPNRNIKMYIGASTRPPSKTNTRDFYYIPKKFTAPSVALMKDWSSDDNIYIRIKVMDSGCGLTPDERQILFNRFQQANPRTHAQYGGSGLGLFISRQLTELHGGQIGVASKADEGSTFGFYIQTRRLPPPDHHAEKGPIKDTIHAEVTPEQRPNTPSIIASYIEKEMLQTTHIMDSTQTSIPLQPEPIYPSALHILVVEDNLVNQKVLMRQLEKTGSAVLVADNGQQALDFLETSEFCEEGGQKLSVILMDLEMPVMDGLTCVRNIRQLENEGIIKRRIPVIAVTANVRLEQVLEARAAGMDDVVSKPFRIPELLAKINILLDRSES